MYDVTLMMSSCVSLYQPLQTKHAKEHRTPQFMYSLSSALTQAVVRGEAGGAVILQLNYATSCYSTYVPCVAGRFGGDVFGLIGSFQNSPQIFPIANTTIALWLSNHQSTVYPVKCYFCTMCPN